MPALRVAERGQELATEALAALGGLDELGPSIERQIGQALRAAGIDDPAKAAPAMSARRRVSIRWLVPALAAVGVTVWLLLRLL